MAVNSCEPETAVESSRYTRLALISSARSGVGATRSISSSKVRLGSSIIAHNSPVTSRPPPASRSGSIRRGSFSSSASPSAFASRRAGSIVTTATFAPRAAIPSATAAEVVVLPTPPEPAHTQTRLPSSISTTLTAGAPARRPGPRPPRGRRGRRTGTGAPLAARRARPAAALPARAGSPLARARTAPPPAAGGGRVDDHQVVRVRSRGPSGALGELPHLADAEQLAHPGRGHGERVEQPARSEHVADGADLHPQVLVHRVLGIDRDREQP